MNEAEQAIADYRTAYEAAHGQLCGYAISYSHGWVAMKHPTSPAINRRLAQLREMTRRLRGVAMIRRTARLQGGSDE